MKGKKLPSKKRWAPIILRAASWLQINGSHHRRTQIRNILWAHRSWMPGEQSQHITVIQKRKSIYQRRTSFTIKAIFSRYLNKRPSRRSDSNYWERMQDTKEVPNQPVGIEGNFSISDQIFKSKHKVPQQLIKEKCKQMREWAKASIILQSRPKESWYKAYITQTTNRQKKSTRWQTRSKWEFPKSRKSACFRTTKVQL